MAVLWHNKNSKCKWLIQRFSYCWPANVDERGTIVQFINNEHWYSSLFLHRKKHTLSHVLNPNLPLFSLLVLRLVHSNWRTNVFPFEAKRVIWNAGQAVPIWEWKAKEMWLTVEWNLLRFSGNLEYVILFPITLRTFQLLSGKPLQSVFAIFIVIPQN